MSGWSATLPRNEPSRFGGYRKAVLAKSLPRFEFDHERVDAPSIVRTAQEELERALREFRATSPDVWNGVNEAYQALVDKKHSGGLSVDETGRMERLGLALDRLVEPYDLARIAFIKSRSPHG